LAASRSSSSASHAALREIADLLLRLELDKGLCHAVELKGSELVESGMGEHRS
jgi:hypothetical protein